LVTPVQEKFSGMQTIEASRIADQASEMPESGRAGQVPAGGAMAAVMRGRTGLARNLPCLHVVALVLVRLLRSADDFSNWDLTGFLNANSFSTLWELLARPEVHFRNPFSFPQLNVGAESVLSALLFRILAHVSLYWAPVVVLLVYDALFLFLLHVLFRQIYGNILGESLAWLLLSMSPVILTFMSTSAFNMQSYGVIVLGLVGSEYFLQRRPVAGFVLLAAAFCLISQAYPLAFYLPYFIAAWCTYRAIGRPPRGVSFPQRAVLAVVQLLLVAGLAYLVDLASSRRYFRFIAPGDPYAGASGEPASARLARSGWVFLRQSFLPAERVDGVPVGFAPYFLYVMLIGVAVLVIVGVVRRRGLPRPHGKLARGLMSACADLGLVVFGYLPAFISVVVKSQRSFFGDLFLVIVAVFWLMDLVNNGWIKRAPLWSLLAVLLCASDAYYLYFTLSVDHSRNHYPRFDYDRADGIARHDLTAAIEAMKRQVEQDGAVVVIYYPREYSENSTDPAVFFARFLRHFGPYRDRPELIIPCRWCEAAGGIQYGCPFPEVLNQECGQVCCYSDPLAEIVRRGLTVRKVVLWWHTTPRGVKPATVPGVTLGSTLQRFAERYRVSGATVPSEATEWYTFEFLPVAAGGSPPGAGPVHEPTTP
jgi:hypothetical protein